MLVRLVITDDNFTYLVITFNKSLVKFVPIVHIYKYINCSLITNVYQIFSQGIKAGQSFKTIKYKTRNWNLISPAFWVEGLGIYFFISFKDKTDSTLSPHQVWGEYFGIEKDQ